MISPSTLAGRMLLSFLVAFVFILGSCKKDDVGQGNLIPADSIQRINKWILDSMATYYYWSTSIPGIQSLSGNPQSFFQGLLNNKDDFSEISDGNTISFPGSTFGYYGFQYIIFKEGTYSSTNLLGLITLVAADGSADRAGLVRGFYFNKVDGQNITSSNVQAIGNMLKSGNAVKITLIKDSSGTWKETGVKTVSRIFFEDRPVYDTRVFSKNGKKTAYIFYNSFSETFDADLFQAFTSLSSRNPTELIIDLRYNMGGSVASAAKLCALTANVSASDVFAIYQGNDRLKEQVQSFQKTINTSASNFGKNFSEILSRRISLSKIYVLSSEVTASSAELLINNLKPYMQVIHIGETTYGKDVATTLIKDLQHPQKISWQLKPVVFKLYNAQHKGDYEEGIPADHKILQYEHLPLQPIGSPSDGLIKKALELIYGDNQVSSEVLRSASKMLSPMERSRKLESLLFDSMKQQEKGESNVPVVSLQ